MAVFPGTQNKNQSFKKFSNMFFFYLESDFVCNVACMTIIEQFSFIFFLDNIENYVLDIVPIHAAGADRRI